MSTERLASVSKQALRSVLGRFQETFSFKGKDLVNKILREREKL